MAPFFPQIHWIIITLPSCITILGSYVFLRSIFGQRPSQLWRCPKYGYPKPCVLPLIRSNNLDVFAVPPFPEAPTVPCGFLTQAGARSGESS